MSYYIGIELGGMSAKCALLRDGKLCGVSRCKTEKELSPAEIAHRLAALGELAFGAGKK